MPGSRAACRPVRLLVAGIAFGAHLTAGSSDARGEDPPAEPIVFAYTADDGCPAKSDFFASTRRYTSKWTPVASGTEALRVFEVRLARHGKGHAGTLVIRTPDGGSSTRVIVGPDCASVARGLAVVVALAIDPQAHIGEPGSGAEPEVSPPGVVTTEPTEPAARPAPAPVGGANAVVPAAPRPERPRFAFAVEARAELTTAVISEPLPVIGAAFEARAHLGAAVPSWISPSIAVGARQSLTQRISVGSGAADFTWTAATVRLCPVRFVTLAARFEATPCLELDVGALRAEPRGLSDARTSSSSWFDRGASVRASYLLSPSWAVGAQLLLTAPATRNRYALSTGELISQAPGAGITAGLVVELRL